MPRFQATIQADDPRKTMTFIEVPQRIMAALDSRKRVPVRVTINGFTYRSTNAIYGGKSYLPVRAEVRKGAGVQATDRVWVTVEVDHDSRAVEPPKDLASALRTAKLRDAFARLAPTHQREYVTWLEDAKRPETRERRITKIVEALREKQART